MAVGERVEEARIVGRLLERYPRIPGGLVEVALGVGDEPGILVVALRLLRERLNLGVDLLERPLDLRGGVGTLGGRVV